MADPLLNDFATAASPGSDWPALIGTVDDENPSPASIVEAGGGNTVNYTLVYVWQVD